MDDFFERRVHGEIVDVVAAIGQSPDLTLDITEHRLSNDDALEPTIYDDTCHNLAKIQESGPTASFAERFADVAAVMFPADRNARAACV